MDDIGKYVERRFPTFRIPTIDSLELGKKKHHIPFMFDVDVTESRNHFRAFKQKTGESLSFTGWVVMCLGRAVSEHKHIHAMRKGRRRLILFDEVDIAIVVERSVSDHESISETLPMPYVIRKANEKTTRAIHDEIRRAEKESFHEGEVQLGTNRDSWLTGLFTMMPRFLRYFFVWRRLIHDPFFAKRMMGTVGVTTVGTIGISRDYGWGIPLGIHPLIVALGTIARKPGVVDDVITIREYLSMTVLFDHDVTDGAPVGRFIHRLKELLESGYGLDRA